MCSNIPASPAYGVYISQLIRYARASSNYSDFLKWKSGLIRGVVSLEGDNLVVFYMISLHLKNSLIRGVIALNSYR
jgi:hypothetical protein